MYEKRMDGQETWWMRRIRRQVHDIEQSMERHKDEAYENDQWLNLKAKRDRLAADYVERAMKVLGE
jgi:hypothetical protein